MAHDPSLPRIQAEPPPRRRKQTRMTGKPSPHSDDDTFDLVDDALATLAERRGIWLGDDLATMTLIASLIEQAERCLPQAVHDARANGHT